MLILSSEQVLSAHRALTSAGIRLGDTTEVEVALGLTPSLLVTSIANLAFCSAWIHRGKVIRQGNSWQRYLAIHGEILFMNPEEMIDRLKERTGVAYLRGLVHINGRVEFTIDPNSIKVVSVSEQDAHQLRVPWGKATSRQILKNIRSAVPVLS